MAKSKSSLAANAVPLVLGIEGGATNTSVLLTDANGREIRQWSEGAANQRLMSDRELTDHFRTIAAKAPEPLAALGIGLAGTRTELHRQRILRLAARVWPGVPCIATNDLETALAAEPARKGVA